MRHTYGLRFLPSIWLRLSALTRAMSGPQVVPELHEAARRHPGFATSEHALGDARRELFHPASPLSSVVGPVLANV